MSWLSVPMPADGHVSRYTVSAIVGEHGDWRRFNRYCDEGEARRYVTDVLEQDAAVAEELHGLHGENMVGLGNAGHRRLVIVYRAVDAERHARESQRDGQMSLL